MHIFSAKYPGKYTTFVLDVGDEITSPALGWLSVPQLQMVENAYFSINLGNYVVGKDGSETYALTSGTLPTGVGLSTAGVISGAPETVVVLGDITVTVSRPSETAANDITYTVTAATPGGITSTLNTVDYSLETGTAYFYWGDAGYIQTSLDAVSYRYSVGTFSVGQVDFLSVTYRWALNEGRGTVARCATNSDYNATVNAAGWLAIPTNYRKYLINEGTGATLSDVIGGYDATIQNYTDEWS